MSNPNNPRMMPQTRVNARGAYRGQGQCQGPYQPPYGEVTPGVSQSAGGQPYVQRSPWPQQPAPSPQARWNGQNSQKERLYRQGQRGSQAVPPYGYPTIPSRQPRDRRIDVLPDRIINVVFIVILLFLAIMPSFTRGVGAGALRGKLVFGIVLLAVGVAGVIYVLAKAVPRLRLATGTRCGWKVGVSGWMTAILIVVVLVGGGILTSAAASDYSTGPVTDTVTYVGGGTFSASYGSGARYGSSSRYRRSYHHHRSYHHSNTRSRRSDSYYEFRTDSGKTLRIGMSDGYAGLMPRDLAYGDRVVLTYYPRTGILVLDPAPRIVS